jgi:superfamily II DNA or RNA helicase
MNGPEYYGSIPNAIDLTSVRSRRIWDVLGEVEEMGLALMQAGRTAEPVLISREPARLTVRARRQGADILMTPTLATGAETVDRDNHVLVGNPPHGVIWWDNRNALRLAPLARGTDLDGAISSPPVRVPAAQEERFLRHVYPRLSARLPVVSDDSVELPKVGRSQLVLRVRTLGRLARGVELEWTWSVPVGDVRREEPLWTDVKGADAEHRGELTGQVLELIAKRTPSAVDELLVGRRLAAAANVSGDELVRFLSEVLPALRDLDDVDVQAPSELLELDCHESQERPSIRFEADRSDDRDWYDLAVEVNVGGEQVTFHELFVALAQEREFLLLPSGAFFSLNQPEFRQLHELIVESREMEDAPGGMLRVGRYQVGLWEELADVGEVTGAAAVWLASLREILERDAQIPLPAGLRATLRPYQREGLTWLAARYDHDLGGILADDMGLGKTVQALALICHAREHWDVGPFLVVTPASVVSNWVAESLRFAPDLDVRAVTQTEVRRGAPLSEAVRDADIVVTSYTLFRLEYDDYESLTWAGLVLDEAQFVKNPHSKGFECAMKLPTLFKLAITGTPMENNLAELWSLCTITMPGIFGRLDRFTDHYRNPIERGHDAARLDQLRRRIRPFLLRRRKADVAIDLPPKQEQIVELELAPQHRRVYQTYLQRERQKVLGLLGDMNKNRFEIFRSLMLLRQAALDVALVGHKQAIPSTKLDHLVEQVMDITAEGHRTLVFSQFTRFLGAARQRLEHAGITCGYLDGSTTRRADVIEEFKHGHAPVFLISLKAGGFGLNLTEADYCILLDPWWNPATEAQAVDRIHRIGQTRNVMVYRLVAKDTIEEKVMALKARKAELFRGVMDEGGFANAHLSPEDIRALLA